MLHGYRCVYPGLQFTLSRLHQTLFILGEQIDKLFCCRATLARAIYGHTSAGCWRGRRVRWGDCKCCVNACASMYTRYIHGFITMHFTEKGTDMGNCWLLSASNGMARIGIVYDHATGFCSVCTMRAITLHSLTYPLIANWYEGEWTQRLCHGE